jgi:hypothetical protein
MSKYTEAALMLSSDGRLSGPIFLRKKNQKYWRRRYPTKNLTPKQRASTLAFKIVDKSWVHLPRAWKDEWNAYRRWEAKLGYNQFQKVNISLVYAGLPLIWRPSSIP